MLKSMKNVLLFQWKSCIYCLFVLFCPFFKQIFVLISCFLKRNWNGRSANLSKLFFCTWFLDLPRRSFKLTDVRPFVRPSARLLPTFLGVGSLVFSNFLHNYAKWRFPKSDGSWFSKKKFSGQKWRKYAGKPVFWHFLEILSLFFSDFLHKDAY